MVFDNNDLHIVFGDSADGTVLRATGADRDSFIGFIDPLASGPLAPIERRLAWNKLRAGHWHAPEPGVDMLARLEAAGDRIEAAPALYIWNGLELSERLFVGWLIAAFRLLGLPLERLYLIDESQFPPDRPFMGSIPREMAASWDRWRLLDAEAQLPFDAMWQAVTAPTPDRLIACCAADSPHTDAVKDAMRGYMAHYPAAGTGVNKWDRLLLHSSRDNAPSSVRTVGQVLAAANKPDAGYPDFVGDVVLFDRLKRMGDPVLPRPLVELTGDLSAMSFTQVVLTETGAAVLDGKANAIECNGIEEQIGGVRLSAKDSAIWLFDGETLVRA